MSHWHLIQNLKGHRLPIACKECGQGRRVAFQNAAKEEMPRKGETDKQTEVNNKEVRHIGCTIHNGLDHHIQSWIGGEGFEESQNQGHKIPWSW